ncbi:MAG: sensor histidine kinase, partial [Aurantimonas coralicida]|nr:sensor histidine kinase [Aurantimonas coralicida]
DVGTYFEGIADSIRSSLLGPGSSVAIAVDSEDLSILADYAVPIGLLVNELATNAVKYAFPEGRGRIVLGFRRRDGEVTLSVQDDGIGLDASARPGPGSGMGSRFVDAFVRQIGGTLARAGGANGTTVTVRLPASILAG